MRRVLIAVPLLLVHSVQGAPLPAPVQSSDEPGDLLTQAQRQRMVDTVWRVAQFIEARYAREVDVRELILSAITSLHERGRVPLARGLRDEIFGSGVNQSDLRNLLEQTLKQLENNPFIETDRLAIIACDAMVESLDPFSQIVLPDRREKGPSMESDMIGTGIEVEPYLGVGAVRVANVAIGSPAQRAGVRPGDGITKLDDKPVEKLQPDAIYGLLTTIPDKLDGNPAAVREKPIRVTFRRDGKEQTVEVERKPFGVEVVLGVRREDNHSWDYIIDREQRLAYVRLAKLTQDADHQLDQVVSQLKRRGVRGIIFDLRWCPGGYLSPAVDCARLFLGEATIATIKSRDAEPNVYRSSGEGVFPSLPVVVLINEQTSGGAELIACALQDHKRALMVGERSRGKASVQSPISSFEFPDAPPGLTLKLTTGIFYRPSGKNLNRFKDSKPTDDWGVLPDPGQAFPLSRAMSEQLKKWWELQALRPGPSMERLPLDNLDADPQLKAALGTLRKIIKE